MIRVQDSPFDPGAELNSFLARNRNSGGVANFVGQVRNFNSPDTDSHAPPTSQQQSAISSLELEHYPGMTEKELARICDDANSRWPLDDIFVIHRYGVMTPGDPIVLVCTAATHRGDAFAACEFVMDWLKTHAPFWKREHTNIGASWVEAKQVDDDRTARWNKQATESKIKRS